MTDLHAVFATLTDGTRYRISDWTDWTAAQDLWNGLDVQRRTEGLATLRVPGNPRKAVKFYEVRSQHDPNYKGLLYVDVVTSYRAFAILTERSYTTDTAAAKAVLKPLGYYGTSGGYIRFRDRGEARVLTQGWWSAARVTGHNVVTLDGESGRYRAVVSYLPLVKHEVLA